MQYLIYLGELALRALALGAIGLLATRLLRRRSAEIQHLALAAVLVAMIALPLLMVLLPVVRLLPASKIRNHSSINAVFPVATPSAAPSGPRSEPEGSLTVAPLPRVGSFPGWPMLLLAGYSVATGYQLLRSARAVGKARRMVKRCAPITAAPPNALLCDLAVVHAMAYPLPELLESPEEVVPFVAGWRDPVIVLPANWREWDEFKIGSVLAHELAHVRRNDWRTAILASLNRAIFWYHPVAWWLERQLRRVAEEACDAAAIRSMHDTHRYAAVVLEFAVSVQPGLEWPATAMARSSKAGGRIERILDERALWKSVASRGVRLRILLVLFPLVYAATALQIRGTDPISHRPFLKEAEQATILSEGWKVTPDEANRLEAQLERDPDNVEARIRLLSHYYQRMQPAPRVKHLLWLIANHPEADVFRTGPGFSIAPDWSGLNDSDTYQQAKKLWLAHVQRLPADTRIIAHAAVALMNPEPEAALELVRRARRIEPTNSEWVEWLADTYHLAVRAAFAGGPERIRERAGFGRRSRWFGFWLPLPASLQLKTELKMSTDAALVGATGEWLVRETNRLNDNDEVRQSKAFGETLLGRARSLEPDNLRWNR